MKQLLILRHAKAHAAFRNQPDHDRELNDHGQAAAHEVGQRLADAAMIPDLIISSDAMRTAQTARCAADSAGYCGPIEETATLYLATAERYLDVLADVAEPVSRVLIVGHNPGMEDLVEMLTCRPTEMPTAALALVELNIEQWDALRDAKPTATLVEHWTSDGYN